MPLVNLKDVFIATRPWSFPASLVGIVLGSAAAWTTGTFSLHKFLVTLIGGLSIHAAGNLWNTYYDFKHGLDKRDTADDRTLFDLSLTPNNVAHLSILAFIFALISGAYLVLSLQEIRLFYLLLAGLVLTFFYTAGPIKLKYRALGDITIFLCFGPLIAEGTYFIQTRSFSRPLLPFAIAVGLLVEAILHVNNTRDVEADRKAGARTIAQFLGKTGNYLLYVALVVGAYGILLWQAYQYETFALLLPFVVYGIPLRLIRSFMDQEWGELTASTAQFSLLFGLLLSVGLALSGHHF